MNPDVVEGIAGAGQTPRESGRAACCPRDSPLRQGAQMLDSIPARKTGSGH